ncbi:MAG: TlpA family protein disulfide reductase [Rhodopirellula sp.]|nr:TlpA family protein disulfide reductase [Rhodopirellula sp.]
MVELPVTIRNQTTMLQNLLGVIAMLVSILIPTHSFAAEQPLALPSLHLVNGSFLPGRILESDTPDQITWHSSLFTKPFEFPLAGVSAIQYPVTAPAPEPSGEYCVELSSGDVFYGDLLELTDADLRIQTKTIGTISILREDVHRIYRWQETALIYLGPDGLEGWQDGDVEARFSRRWSDEGGWPTTSRADATLFRNAKLPPRASIEFEVSWKNRPDFQFMFGVDEMQSGDLHVFRLEVWDDHVVLMGETDRDADVAVVSPIAGGAGAIRGLLYLDQEKQRISLYSRTGSHKASLKLHSKTPTTRQGLRLINRNGDVRLNHLRIAHWDGILPRDVQTDKSRIHRTDGTIAYGQVTAFNPKSGSFTIRNEEQTTELAAGAVSDIFLSPAADDAKPANDKAADGNSQVPRSPLLRIVYQDGSRFSGRLNAIQNRTLQVTSPSIREPLQLPMLGIRSIGSGTESTVPATDPIMASGRRGRLEVDHLILHGRLTDGSEQPNASCLAWHPDFSLNASPLAKNVSGRIVYREPPKPKTETSNVAQDRQVVIRQLNQKPAIQGFGDVFRQMLIGKATLVQKPEASSPQTLHLRTGDTIPCEVVSVDEDGLHFTTPLSDATFVSNERIKGVELDGQLGSPTLDETKRNRLLTLPRLQKGSPPTHLIYSANGDFLRGRLIGMNQQVLTVEVRLANREIPRHRVSQIIWLHPDELQSSGKSDQPAPNETLPVEVVATDNGGSTSVDGSDIGNKPPPASVTRVQTLVRHKDRLTFLARKVEGSVLSGKSDILGECHSELADIDQLLFGDYIEQAAAQLAYHRWKLHYATEPKFALAGDGDGGAAPVSGTESPLVGQPAPDFKLSALDGGDFELAEHRGEIIVLDFWATWCSPCLQTMPLVDGVVREFPDQKVRLLAVNMEEQPAEIKSTLERHQLKVPVILDIDGVAAARYAVTSIPQTVVIDREGNIARLFIGGGPKLAEPLRQALKELTDTPASPEAATTTEDTSTK